LKTLTDTGTKKGGAYSSIKTYINTPLYKKYGIELSLTRNNADTSGIFSISYGQYKDKRTTTIRTGETTSFEYCDGVRLYLWLQKWENRTGNKKNNEAIFQAIVCPIPEQASKK
jgi:hypothetical protein